MLSFIHHSYDTVFFQAPGRDLHPSNYTRTDLEYLANSFEYPPSHKLEVCGSGMRAKRDKIVVSFRNCSASKIAVPLPPYAPGKYTLVTFKHHDI